MKKKLEIGLFAILGTIFLVFARDYFLNYHSLLQIYGEKNALLIKTENGEIIFFGKKSDSTEAIRRAISPYFLAQENLNIETAEIEKQYEGKDFTVQKLSENMAHGTFNGQNIFFFGKADKDEETNLKAQKIGLNSDFWVLKSSYFPDFLPAPEVAIIFLGERKPGKLIRNFARENKTPLLSFRDTQGFVLGKEKDGWELKTR